jgi:hypothetical protein
MPSNGSDARERPHLTVGSLLGVPLGSTGSQAGVVPAMPASPAAGAPQAAQAAPGVAAQPPVISAGPVVSEEKPWTLSDGTLNPQWERPQYRPDGVEAISYNNVFGQAIEQAWFDGKLVYALDAGEVDVDPARVKVAQEYQIVYAVDLDEQRKKRAEPARVPGQLNIYDSVPGMDKYSPIWQFDYVIVPRNYRANALRSEADCLSSGYQVIRSNDFEN